MKNKIKESLKKLREKETYTKFSKFVLIEIVAPFLCGITTNHLIDLINPSVGIVPIEQHRKVK